MIARTGHFYYADKDDVLWDRVRRRLAAVRLPDVESYVRLLDDPQAGPAEWRRLEGEITVGETYFLRYVEQFTALKAHILPELIARHAQTKRLRIWSAGCATGAEPYSVAILLAELLGDQIADWRLTILGTDINESALAAAREARFGAWALRSLSAEQKQAWFTQDDRTWRLRPRFRSLVRFQYGNLLDLLGPAAPLDLTDFDLILCRNVLIYFHPDAMNAVVGALAQRLGDEGWLLVGHAEPNPGFEAHVRTITLPGAVAYRRRTASRRWPTSAPSPIWGGSRRPRTCVGKRLPDRRPTRPRTSIWAWSPRPRGYWTRPKRRFAGRSIWMEPSLWPSITSGFSGLSGATARLDGATWPVWPVWRRP